MNKEISEPESHEYKGSLQDIETSFNKPDNCILECTTLWNSRFEHALLEVNFIPFY